MYAELASIGYWCTLLTGWALILISIYKLIESLNFKLYLTVIGVGIALLYVASHIGDYAEMLYLVDKTFATFSDVLVSILWLALSLIPMMLFGALLDASHTGRAQAARSRTSDEDYQ